MARPLRIEYPGALYHVTSRGNARNKIFKDDQDREVFLAILGAVVTRYNWLLGLFSKRTKTAQKRYQVFVREGINQGSLWGEVRGQVLLGEEKFVEKYKGLIEEKREIQEIPRYQRYVSRPRLKKIFSGQESKTRRNEKIYLACVTHGYKLKGAIVKCGVWDLH